MHALAHTHTCTCTHACTKMYGCRKQISLDLLTSWWSPARKAGGQHRRHWGAGRVGPPLSPAVGPLVYAWSLRCWQPEGLVRLTRPQEARLSVPRAPGGSEDLRVRNVDSRDHLRNSFGTLCCLEPGVQGGAVRDVGSGWSLLPAQLTTAPCWFSVLFCVCSQRGFNQFAFNNT